MSESDEKSLINISDLAGLSKPMIKLVEVTANAIGVIYEPTRKRRMAKATRDEIRTLKEAVKDVDGKVILKNGEWEIALDKDSIEGRSIERMVASEVKKQINVENILGKVEELVSQKECVSDEKVNQDWATRFFKLAEDISDDEMQNLWAKILSDEIERPRTYSLRTLEFIKNLSKEEANLISKFCNLAYRRMDNTICVFTKDELLEKNGISFLDVKLIEELNIAQFGLSCTIDANGKEAFIFNKKALLVDNNDNKGLTIDVAKLTNIGADIYNLTEKNLGLDYFKDITNLIKKEANVSVKLADLFVQEGKTCYDSNALVEL